MAHAVNPNTEPSILESYLLVPSALPTIIPFSDFKDLIPKPYQKDPTHKSTIRQLYRDLQFQRDITLDQVYESIAREATTQAVILKARLARQISAEEGNDSNDGRPRKRRRRQHHGTMNSDDFDDTVSSSDDELASPLTVAAHRAMYEHPSSAHPAAHVLPVSGDMLEQQVRLSSGSAYHTKLSLLRTMEDAERSLGAEISELEAEYVQMKRSIQETVSELSDLRYGKRQSGGEEADEPYKDVLDAVEQFRSIVRSCTGSDVG